MLKYSNIFGAVALIATVQVASAQTSAYFDSSSYFTTSLDSDVTAVVSTGLNVGGPYNFFNLPATTNGDGVNNSPYTYQYYDTDSSGNVTDGYNEASTASTAFSNGSAYQNQGINYFIDFTNNSTTTAENASFTEIVNEYLTPTTTSSNGLAKAVAYGGWFYYNGTSNTGFFTNSLDQSGNTVGTDDFGDPTPSSSNFTVSDTGTGYIQGTSSNTFSLAAGQTITVQFWASGSTTAAVPEPPVALLGLAGIGVLLLRRKSA